MKLADLLERAQAPVPWSEGEKIPWHEPGFSRRMLQEHLSQAHDSASRRRETIESQVSWIHTEVLAERPARVLDLGCGPGLYAERLVPLGHDVTGVDHSPASIAHARANVPQGTFLERDVRGLDFADLGPFSLAMLLFGEVNAFRTEDLGPVFAAIHRALEPGGALLLEPHSFEAARRIGSRPPTWYAVPRGLFSDDPHLCLYESFWDEETATASERWWIVDTATHEVTRHAASMQAYTEDAYRSLVAGEGFEAVEFHSGLGADQDGLFALVARKPA